MDKNEYEGMKTEDKLSRVRSTEGRYTRETRRKQWSHKSTYLDNRVEWKRLCLTGKSGHRHSRSI